MKRTEVFTAKKGQGIFQKILGESKKEIIKAAAAAVISLLFSLIRYNDALTPFGVSVFAAFSSFSAFFAFAGAGVGYALAGLSLGGIRYIAQMMIIAAVKWAFAPFFETEQKWAVPTLAGAVNLAVNSITLFTEGTVIYDILLVFSESILCAGALYFLRETVKIFEKGESLKSAQNVVSFSVFAALVLISVSKISVGAISLSGVIASLFVLSMALSLGSLGGACAGLAVGAALSLSLSDGGFLVMALGLGGMLSGLFSHISRYGVAILFLVCSLLSVAVLSEKGESVYYLYSSLCAAVIFLMIPERLIRIIGYYFPPIAAKGEHYPNKYLAARLDFISKSLMETSKSICDVSDKLDSKTLGDMDKVLGSAADRVCRRCSNKLNCWDNYYNDTMDSFNHIVPVLKTKGKIEVQDAPNLLRLRCSKITALTSEINLSYKKSVEKERIARRMRNIKEVVTEQFSGMSRLLCEMSQELSLTACDIDTENKIESALLKDGVCAAQVSCPIDRFGRKSVEFYCLAGDLKKLDFEVLEDNISEICNTKMIRSSILKNDDLTRLCFSQKPPFSVETAVFQKNASGEEVCGDSYAFLPLNNGYFAAVLSDGMGRGNSASVDSKMTINLISRFISLGFPLENCINLVNSALNLKSEEETLSTLDSAVFDLYAGSVSIKKAGAAPSFLKRNKRVSKISAEALPLGILGEVKVKGAELRLSRGDTLVLCSDGLCALKDNQIESILKKSEGLSCEQIAKTLGQKAAECEGDAAGDDITVLVMKMV